MDLSMIANTVDQTLVVMYYHYYVVLMSLYDTEISVAGRMAFERVSSIFKNPV